MEILVVFFFNMIKRINVFIRDVCWLYNSYEKFMVVLEYFFCCFIIRF